MFYVDSSQMEQTLRFGDVIQGFPICFSIIDSPSSQAPFHINVSTSTFAVVLSPCCSIADRLLAVAPFQQLPGSIFSNEYLAEDPTRINIKIPAEKSVPVAAWEKMPAGERTNRLAKGEAFVFLDLFVYAPSDLFQEYTINRRNGNINTRHYSIDFRTSSRISCGLIKNPNYSPGASKVLQLSIETRELLRKKITSFYGRIPDEERMTLSS